MKRNVVSKVLSFPARFLGAGLLVLLAACSNGSDQQATAAAPPPGYQAAPGQRPPQPAQQQAAVFKTITPQEAFALMQNRQDLLVVDLREPSEMKEGSIEGSQLVPVSSLAKGQANLPMDRPMLLVCAVGGRSWGVGRFLASRGAREIYNLEGGIDNWKKAGLPLSY